MAATYDGIGSFGYRFWLSKSALGWNVSCHSPTGAHWWSDYRATKKAAMNDALRAQGSGTIEWTERIYD
jgi:hypothetical protein